MVSTWKKKGKNTSKFVDAPSNNIIEERRQLTTWKGLIENNGEEI